MSLELFKKVDTAQDLFELLQMIPQAQRERLPLSIVVDDKHDAEGDLNVEAFEVTETEGCIERGFRITGNKLPHDPLHVIMGLS